VRIAVDVMGGDYAPREIVRGAHEGAAPGRSMGGVIPPLIPAPA